MLRCNMTMNHYVYVPTLNLFVNVLVNLASLYKYLTIEKIH